MTSQMRGKGKERLRKVPTRLLDQLSILFCLGIMSMPSFRFSPHRFAGFRFHCIIMILNEATVVSNYPRWPLSNSLKGQFMVSQFWSHGRQLAVVARTGATPVHAGAEAKIRELYVCEFHGKSPTNMKGFSFPYRLTQKTKKNAPSPLEFLKAFKFRGTWHKDLLWKTKYSV